MSNIVISTDSTADLSPELIAKHKISIAPLHVILGEDDYLDGVNITPQMIFEYVAKTGVLPKTSACSVEQYLTLFAELLKNNDEVIHFDISTDCSSSGVNAKLASESFNGKVHVIDTRQLSTGQGLLVMKAVDLRAEGKSAKEIVDYIESIKNKTQTSFVVDTTDYLCKGGRCSSVANLMANIFKIHPSIDMKDGKLGVKKKYRGKLKSCIAKYVDDLAEEYKDYDDTRVFITHASCTDDIVDCIKEKLQQEFKFKEIIVTVAGSVVTSHCGQGTLGVLFIRN